MRRAAWVALSVLGVACGPAATRPISAAFVPWSEFEVDGAVVVERGTDAVEFVNLGAKRATVRQSVDASMRRTGVVEFDVAASVHGDGAHATVRLLATGPEATFTLAALDVAAGAPGAATQVVAWPAWSKQLTVEYSVGPGARLIVARAALRAGAAPAATPVLADATAELLADVARELRYFSPEVPPDFDWTGWIAGADHALRGAANPDVIAYVDAWVKRAAPHATYARHAVAVDPALTGAAALVGPRVNIGPRNLGPFISYIEGLDVPAPIGVYATWALGRPACTRVKASVDSERVPESGAAYVYVVAHTGGFAAARQKAPLRAGEAVAELEVPGEASAVRVTLGFDGASEVVVRKVTVTCDGVTRVLRLEDAALQSDAGSMFERAPGGCPGCVTLRRRTVDRPVARRVALGRGVLTYPLVAPAPTAKAIVVSPGRYALDDLAIAAAQLLYGELRTFAVMAPSHQAELRAAFLAAVRSHRLDSVRAVQAQLEQMTAVLDDGHARVVASASDAGTLPFEVRRFGTEVAIVAVHPMIKDVVSAGARIIAIDGEPIASYLARVRRRVSGATAGWTEVSTARRALYGPIGSMAAVTIAGPGGRQRTLGLPYLDKHRGLDELLPTAPVQGAEVAPGVRYVRLAMIDDGIVRDIAPSLAQARAIVIDLRGYGGPAQLALIAHLIAAPVRSPVWSVPRVGPDGVVAWEDSTWTLYPSTPHVGGRLVVLTDARCISSVETALAILRSAGAAIVVGEPSAGTNGNEVELELPLGLSARYTGMRVLVDGRDYNVTPTAVDVPISWTLADVEAGRDPILARGIALAAAVTP